jgi:hypothetical protein
MTTSGSRLGSGSATPVALPTAATPTFSIAPSPLTVSTSGGTVYSPVRQATPGAYSQAGSVVGGFATGLAKGGVAVGLGYAAGVGLATVASPAVLTGAAIAGVAYGGYSLGRTIYQASTGNETSFWTGNATGRTFTAPQRAEMWGEAAVGVAAIGAGAAKVGSGRANAIIKVPQGHTRVYRAVSEAEYRDIVVTGKLRPGSNSIEGKWFADSIEGAHAHGKALESAGKYRVIQVDIPNNAPSTFRQPNLDGRGPATYLHCDDLDGLVPRPVRGR